MNVLKSNSKVSSSQWRNDKLHKEREREREGKRREGRVEREGRTCGHKRW
jgi:hypothetical protein